MSEPQHSVDDTLELLLFLASLGIPIMPCYGIREDGTCMCPARGGCKAKGKHPQGALVRHGVNDATTDPAVIADWVKRNRGGNWAIATGQPLKSGGWLCVLDIDPRSHGDESLGELEEIHGKLPHTVRVATGGGGAHYYFKSNRQLASRAPYPGVDFKAAGGYVLCPPSTHASGKQYLWDVGGGFDGIL